VKTEPAPTALRVEELEGHTTDDGALRLSIVAFPAGSDDPERIELDLTPTDLRDLIDDLIDHVAVEGTPATAAHWDPTENRVDIIREGSPDPYPLAGI